MAIRCATAATSPVLRKAISGIRRSFGFSRDTMKKIEGLVPDLPIWSKIGAPMFKASEEANVWRAARRTELEKIAKDMSAGETENILAALMDRKGSEQFYNLTGKQIKSATQLENFIKTTLKESGGLTDEQATRFIQQDFAKLRAANGDPSRVSGVHEIYPETFHPFLDEIFSGGVSSTQNNAYAVAWDMIGMGERTRFQRPAAQAVKKEVASWTSSLRGKVPAEDIRFAQSFADDFISANVEQRARTTEVAAQTIGNVMNRVSKVLGRNAVDITDDTINRWSSNMSSWYAGMAMSMRPALAVRNMTQVLLPAAKVGYGRLGRALKDVYGKDRDNLISRALKDLGIPEQGNAIHLGEGTEGFLTSKLLRGIKAAQAQGLRPFRWADRINNRVTTYRMGELAVLDEAPALASGKISTEQFLFRTGLKGSPKVDQQRILSLLRGKEIPDTATAAREYGKLLVQDTQFIYDGVNAPLAFKGAAGRMFGQFGTWPIGFAEFMMQNVAGPRDAAWAKQFVGRYAVQKAALGGVGLATGIDTSSWNFANPLTFQGGPWFQAFRDMSILGTSTNEFERRKARGGVSRMLGQMGTPFAGIVNPFGGATADVIQAMKADDPLSAVLLGTGFNLTK